MIAFYADEKGANVEYYVIMFRIIDSRPLFRPAAEPSSDYDKRRLALIQEFLQFLLERRIAFPKSRVECRELPIKGGLAKLFD
jgi:hypothetical protein